MTIAHNSLERADLKSQVPRHRAIFGSMLLALAFTAALVAGGWGVISSLATGAPPANVGEPVEVPGGLLSVDEVTPENMTPMQMGNLGKQEGMDVTPKGQRRFTVSVTLVAQNGGISYAADDFRVSGKGFEGVAPVRSQLAAGTLATGEAISGNLVFQAPEKAKNLTLDFDGGRGVALDVPAGGTGGDSQGGEAKDEGHGN